MSCNPLKRPSAHVNVVQIAQTIQPTILSVNATSMTCQTNTHTRRAQMCEASNDIVAGPFRPDRQSNAANGGFGFADWCPEAVNVRRVTT